MKKDFPLAKLLPMLQPDLAAQVRASVSDVESALCYRKGFIATQKVEATEDEHAIIQYVSTRDVDRDNEIVDPDGAVLDQFKLAPQVLWGHNYSLPPVGKDEWIRSDGYGIKAKTIYAVDEYGEGGFAGLLYKLRKGDYLKTSSIGFIPIEFVDRDGPGWTEVITRLAAKWNEKPAYFKSAQRIYTKWLLLEHSDVSVPSQINAQTLQVLQKDFGAKPEHLRLLGVVDEPPGEARVCIPCQQAELARRLVRPVTVIMPAVKVVDEREIVQELLDRARGKV